MTNLPRWRLTWQKVNAMSDASAQLQALVGKHVSVLLALSRGDAHITGQLVEVDAQTLTLRSTGGRTAGQETIVMLTYVASVTMVSQASNLEQYNASYRELTQEG
jgi:hypothetical protein